MACERSMAVITEGVKPKRARMGSSMEERVREEREEEGKVVERVSTRALAWASLRLLEEGEGPCACGSRAGEGEGGERRVRAVRVVFPLKMLKRCSKDRPAEEAAVEGEAQDPEG